MLLSKMTILWEFSPINMFIVIFSSNVKDAKFSLIHFLFISTINFSNLRFIGIEHIKHGQKCNTENLHFILMALKSRLI